LASPAQASAPAGRPVGAIEARREALKTAQIVAVEAHERGLRSAALGHERSEVAYNGAAYLHEHLVSKYCTLLGTNIAAVVAYEDRVALNTFGSAQTFGPSRWLASDFRAAACGRLSCGRRTTSWARA
jgi:hypothetical protein